MSFIDDQVLDLDIIEKIKKHQKEVPVQLVALANDLGITVIETPDLLNNQSGAITKSNGDVVIYVNDRDPSNRKRFTLAHEIGHFVLHKKHLDKVKELIDTAVPTQKEVALYRTSPAKFQDSEGQDMEREANKFASDLLMPEDKFIEALTNYKNIQEVADIFKVSESAANFRAEEIFGWSFIV